VLNASGAGTPVMVSFQPSAAKINAGDTVTLTIHMDTVTGLYGLQYKVLFNPQVLQVLDADPSMDGVQIGGSELFQGYGKFETNAVDNATGVITYVVTLVGEHAITATGSLGWIAFQAQGDGASGVHFDPEWTALSDAQGFPIPSQWGSAHITVGSYKLWLPLIRREQQP
jgi:hypothetical protein